MEHRRSFGAKGLAFSLGLGLLLAGGLADAMATGAESGNTRPRYQNHCDLPHVGWNEEVLRARAAAERECKDNLLVLASDRSAAVTTDAQSRFWQLKHDHDSLVQRAR